MVKREDTSLLQASRYPSWYLQFIALHKAIHIVILKHGISTLQKPNLLARLSSDQTGSGYHIAIASEGAYSDFQASVKFKIISGEQQRAAGLIVRFQDVDHYFVLMADAMNQRFSLCRAQTGFQGLVCTQDQHVNITIGQWHSIRAEVAAQGVAGYLDDAFSALRCECKIVSVIAFQQLRRNSPDHNIPICRWCIRRLHSISLQNRSERRATEIWNWGLLYQEEFYSTKFLTNPHKVDVTNVIILR